MSIVQNPSWTKDETLLALNFYFKHRPNFPSLNSTAFKELSEYLRKIQMEIVGNKDTSTLRNVNGMKMKMGNFLHLDKEYPNKKGLTGASKLDQKLFKEFFDNQDELSEIVKQIKNDLNVPVLYPFDIDDIDNENYEAYEGKQQTKEHRYRERDKRIIKLKKEKAFKENTELICEGCAFDFSKVYGARGEGFIECHHIRAVSDISNDEPTKLEDLALLCSNCHRIIHRTKPWLTIEQLKQIINE